MAEELGPVEWLKQPVRIEKYAIYFGDTKVPGCIAQDGVTLKPGGARDLNRLTVEFLVGPVTTDDPMVEVAVFNNDGLKVADGKR